MTTFNPSWLVRYPSVQSVLASLKLRNRRHQSHAAITGARRHLINSGDGVTLMGLHSPQRHPDATRGLVILIHGWEGSHDSAYMVSLTCTLYDAGYNIFRLNLRDHGETHQLNEGVFHSGRIQEVRKAISVILEIDTGSPVFIVGYSLGGNFALRVGISGLESGQQPKLCIGICPAINPRAALTALDDGPKIFHRYFMKKMRRSLDRKSKHWPQHYDFSQVTSQSSFIEATRAFAERHTEYGSLEKYFESYTLTEAMLAKARIPITIIASEDDPVVPFDDFRGMASRQQFRFISTKHGGHCGFLEGIRMKSWAEKRIIALLKTASAAA